MTLHLDPSVRRLDAGTVLVGGSPTRVFRLTAAGARAVERLQHEPPATLAQRRLARRLVDTGLAHPVPDGPSPYTVDDVTVVVPHHHDPEGLARTLDALPGACVVDDPDGRGPAWARNRGWRGANTDLVAFVDAGCAPVDGWLHRLLPHFADDQVGGVAPRVRSPLGPSITARYDAHRSPLDLGSVPAIARPGGRVPYVPTTALIVRRRDLELVDGFDESLRYGEDVDFVWRLHAAGRLVRYEPSAVVWHDPRRTLGALARQRFAYGTSAAALAARHGDAVAPVATSPWNLAACALAASGHAMAATAVAVSNVVDGVRRTPLPASVTSRLALEGQVRAGLALAEAGRRVWWPIVLLASVRSRRARRLALACVVPIVGDWFRRRPPLDPITWTIVRLLDDLAYGAGVWTGMWRERSLRAVLPAAGVPGSRNVRRR